MTDDTPSVGWHSDPAGPDQYRYWDGRRWSGFSQVVQREGEQDDHDVIAASGGYTLTGWKRVWYRQVVHLPFVFYPLAWFDCSVPFTKGHLDRLMWPAEARFRSWRDMV